MGSLRHSVGLCSVQSEPGVRSGLGADDSYDAEMREELWRSGFSSHPRSHAVLDQALSPERYERTLGMRDLVMGVAYSPVEL